MMQFPHRALLAATAAITLLATSSAQTPLATFRIATGFQSPLYAGAPPGDEDRLFILEQSTGRIRVIKNGTVLATAFLDIGTKIRTGSERGLLGLAFHPDYDTNGFLYVNYTRSSDAATVVERYTVSANPDVADPSSGTPILGPITQPFSNHNGGCVAFGPDGFLYVSTGDGGSGGDPGCRAQNRGLLLGKILRIDVDGGTPYAIPPTNPYAQSFELAREIWSYGWRNPWRFSFDRETGDLYVGDVGQSTREEISFQPASSVGGENYGWKMMEGVNCFSRAACPTNVPQCNAPTLVDPIHDYANAGSDCSVTGGYVYRGCAIPSLQGTYFYADYCSGRIWSFVYDGTNLTQLQQRTTELTPTNGGSIGRITSFGENGRGEIIIVDRDGDIFQIVARGAAQTRNLGFGMVGGNGLTPSFEVCGLLQAGESATFILRFGPANAPAALVLSDMQNPTAFPFGTIVPLPPRLVVSTMTDADGRIELPIAGGFGPTTIYGQWGLLDQGASQGIGVSNALEIIFP